jgi:glutaminase
LEDFYAHAMLPFQTILESLYAEIKQQENPGAPAAYIPELSRVDPEKFGVFLVTTQNETSCIGDCFEKFSIQSIVKVLSLALAYKLSGEALWSRLGYEPAGTPFNSLVQLESDQGIPRNPLINSGALVICDVLISKLDNHQEAFLEFVRDVSGNPGIQFSPAIAQSEKSAGYRNIALCNFIKSFGNIKNDADAVLDFYFNICSIELSCEALAETFLFLANNGRKTLSGQQVLTTSQVKRINAIMQTCGLYDESGEFAFKVGLPGKSGVGGGIVAVHPNQYCIAVWSPRLNRRGNSYRGIRFLEEFTTRTELSIF